MNTFAASHKDSPALAVVLTVLAGFVPYAGVALPSLVALRYIRRNRDNRGLCAILIIIALVFAVLWVAYFAWMGGSESIHPNHPVKVP